MKQIRMKPAARRVEILGAAIRLAEEVGYSNVTRLAVATACGIKAPTVQYYFKSVAVLRQAVLELAILRENMRIIAQAVVAQDPQVVELPEELKRRALASV